MTKSNILLWMGRVSLIYFAAFQLVPFFTKTSWMTIEGVPDMVTLILGIIYFLCFGIILGNAFSRYGERSVEARKMAYFAIFLFFVPFTTLLYSYLKK
jgi:hypothetical protein